MDAHSTVAKCLAILQGKESRHTVGLTVALWQQYYSQAHALYTSNHIAVLVNGEYRVEKHEPAWTRRIR